MKAREPANIEGILEPMKDVQTRPMSNRCFPMAPRTNRFIIKCGDELMSQALFSLFSVRSEPTMMVKTIMGTTTSIIG